MRFAKRAVALAVTAVALTSSSRLLAADTDEAKPKPADTTTADGAPRGPDASAPSPSVPETMKKRAWTFEVDPIADGAIMTGALGFNVLLELVNSTGEIRPQQISPSFNRRQLLGIDRVALSQTVDPHAGTYTNVGVAAACVFAAVDPVLSGFRERSVQTGLVDAMMYAESITLTLGVTDLVKMAVRRPRPRAYVAAEQHENDPSYANADTDSALSFFSGHTALVSTIGATATYLAFARAPKTARPWITLGASTALTTFVAIERVRAGAHFPTDVIAATLAGAGIGVIVPHLHRTDDVEQRHVWVGLAPAEGRGASASVSGVF